MHRVMAKGILSADNSMNLYRGCQHGCIYCNSRSRRSRRCAASGGNGLETDIGRIFTCLRTWENRNYQQMELNL